MSQVTFVSGQMQEFVSNIKFSLNFEDRKSVMVQVGDTVNYDGSIARYRKPTGEEVVGKTSSLKSAILDHNWLSAPGVEKAPADIKPPDNRKQDVIPTKAPDYNPLTGGSFDKFLESSQGKSEIIREETTIAKETNFLTPKTPEEKERSERMEIAGDQVPVKSGPTLVSSSTVPSPGMSTHSSKITKSEDYGAAGVQNMKRVGKQSQGTTKKASTFTVDSNTPQVSDGASMEEFHRATSQVQEESQGARVVKKIGQPRTKLAVESDILSDARVVGTIGKKAISEEEGIAFAQTTGPRESDGQAVLGGQQEGITLKPKAQVRGSEPVVDLSGAKTQADVDEREKAVLGPSKSELEKKFGAAAKNYLDMLPEDWSKLHWVKKEQFILKITDREFVKFILTVDTVKAVQAACRKRLLELEKSARNG
jgi:hypothetical protein